MKKILFAGMATILVLMLVLSVSIAEDFEPEEPNEYIEVALSNKFENAAPIEPGKFYGVSEKTNSSRCEFSFKAEESGIHTFYCRSTTGDGVEFILTDKYAEKISDYIANSKNKYAPQLYEIELTAGKEYHLRKTNGFISSGNHTYVFAICSPSHHVGPLTATKVTQEPTCAEPGVQAQCCALCGGEVNRVNIPPIGHKPGELQTFKEATCLKAGSRGTKCTECGEILSQLVIPKTEHTPDAWVEIRPATCTGEGNRVQYCSVCGEALKTETVQPLGHSYSEWAENGEGKQSRYCIYCGNTETRDTPAN